MFIYGVCACTSMCGVAPFHFFLGLERDKFDNKTVTFEEHIKVEHNMWHYLFFIVLVKVKDSTEYTGPESYVAEMIRVRMIVLHMHSTSHRFEVNKIYFHKSSVLEPPHPPHPHKKKLACYCRRQFVCLWRFQMQECHETQTVVFTEVKLCS